MNLYNAEKICRIKNINAQDIYKKRLELFNIKSQSVVRIFHKCISGVVVIADEMPIAISRKLAENIEVYDYE